MVHGDCMGIGGMQWQQVPINLSCSGSWLQYFTAVSSLDTSTLPSEESILQLLLLHWLCALFSRFELSFTNELRINVKGAICKNWPAVKYIRVSISLEWLLTLFRLRINVCSYCSLLVTSISCAANQGSVGVHEDKGFWVQG